MKINILISATTFILFLIGSGSISLAEEKKNDPLPPANIQQGCSEDEQETPSCSAASSPLFDTSENKASTFDSKPGPSSTIIKKTDRAKIDPEKGTPDGEENP